MLISMVLQIVLGEPVLILYGIEEVNVLAGHADLAEANADMVLNNAIHKEFAPNFAQDWETAVEHPRHVLKSEK